MQQCLVFALPGNGRIDGPIEVVEIVGNEVGQIGVLGVVPALLNRIQLGTVRRQRLECEPCGVAFLKVRRGRSMHVPAIPHHNNVAAVVAMQKPKQPDHVERVHILRQKMKEER